MAREASRDGLDDEVLRDICANSRVSGEAEDEDLSLAKALQEQERCFMMLQGASRGPSLFGFRPVENQSEEASGSGAGGEAEEDEDVAFARRLQQEEEQLLHQHIMQMAGFGAEGQEGDGEGEEGYYSEDSVDPDNMTYEELQALGDAVGTVSKGISKDVISSLPKSKYASTSEEQCAVCRMEFEQGEDINLLPCSHFYHINCISQWLAINKVCPICSKEVTAPKAGSARRSRPTSSKKKAAV